MKYFLGLILTTTFNCAAQTGDSLTAGSPIKKAATIEAEYNKYILYMEMPDGKIRNMSLQTRSVEELEFNNVKTWALIQKYQSDKGINADTSYFMPGTLLPIAYRTYIATQGAYKEVVDITQGKIKSTVIYTDSVKNNDKDVAYNFYNATMDAYIISKLPLKEGYATKFKAINTGKNYFEFTIKIKVTSSEKIVLPGGKEIDCWIVEEDNGGPMKSYLWYSKTNQEYIKRKFGTKERGFFWNIRIM